MEPKIVLFQGDSITDTDRSRDTDINPGFGYGDMVAGALGYQYPYQYKCFNRGISGNRVVDLYARLRIDMLQLKPDYMSILIGHGFMNVYIYQNSSDFAI